MVIPDGLMLDGADLQDEEVQAVINAVIAHDAYEARLEEEEKEKERVKEQENNQTNNLDRKNEDEDKNK
ncbi:MAG: hypothetical protein EZS28_012686 [Streblomastix strix]|uniref:Uncharacterized protein n=1 Tax=Streblomastix strix TaxID=222440 RepID=A0A5J4WBP7_9EUKA|nr:MAG: hypothetical protein EZS28_012686 [Streblomastix strix]